MKTISKLSFKPFTIDYTDKVCVLFITNLGDIYVDEGSGDGRINSAVFTVRNVPKFYIDYQDRLMLRYCNSDFCFGSYCDLDKLEEWVQCANSHIKSIIETI